MHRRILVVLVLLALAAVPAFANHSWGGYHWARTANPFTLKVHDNVNATWEPYLAEAQSDWSASSVLDLNVLWGQPLTSARKCGSTTGRIEACNARYGNVGWLGLASIWLTGGTHITKAYTKVNDTYFDTATYNKPAWRRLVMCQEIAHDFGLDHQDETFGNANLGSCMDYTDDPDGGPGGEGSETDPSNEHPNAHDFQQIQTIYQHLDSFNSYTLLFDAITEDATRPKSMEEILYDAGQWGTPVRFDKQGRPNVFRMTLGVNDKGETEDVFTHVFWLPIPVDVPELPERDRTNVE